MEVEIDFIRVMALTGTSIQKMGPGFEATNNGSHMTDVSVRLVSMDQRDVGSVRSLVNGEKRTKIL